MPDFCYNWRMSSIRTRIPLIASALAAAAIAAFLIWAFSLESTAGLYEWHPPWRRNFLLIGGAGLLPALLALGGLALRSRAPGGKGLAGKSLSAASLGFSAIALALAGGLFGYIVSSTAAPRDPIPALSLIDPAAGIEGREGVVRLSLSSDPHWGREESDAEARSAILRGVASASPRRDAFIILGDNVETGTDAGPWREEAADLSLLGDVPLRSLLGNHDGVIGGQAHFLRYFFPNGVDTDSGSPFYYSMKAGPARIIVLDLLWGAESFSRAQAAWLERTLSSLPAGAQAIVLSHCFFYASGYVDEHGYGYYDHPGTIAKVAPILERHKVALVVSGHNHDMELLRHGGVTYAVVGAMGGLLDDHITYRSPASLWLAQGVHGRLDLDISEAGIVMAFKDRDGKTLREELVAKAR
jgi:hypothetical protein